MKTKKKWKDVIIKFQRPIIGAGLVLMYNEDRSIMGQQPMDKTYELLFGDEYKIYCKCRYRYSDGYLEIGERVQADW